MESQSISSTKPNHDWLKAKLDKAKKSGFTNESKEAILKKLKAMLLRRWHFFKEKMSPSHIYASKLNINN